MRLAARQAPRAHRGGGELSAARAAVVSGPRRIDLVRRELGELRPGRVRVEVEGCGVCGSNLPLWEGRPWFDYPRSPGAPGHEGWGRVSACGSGSEAVPVGARVAFLAEDAFAEVVDVGYDELVVLPAELAGVPFPGEALGCGFNVAARSGFGPGTTVAVVGAGFLGAVVTAIAAHAGARVIALSRRQFALDLAGKMGAQATVVNGPGAVEEVLGHTDGRLCDVVVEAVGLQEPLDLAAQLTRERGRLVIAGFHQDGPRSVDLQLWNWRGIDVVNAHERDQRVRLDGIRAAVDAVAAGWFDPAPLYTHRYPLDRLDAALDAMLDRPDGFLKALVCP